MRRTWGSVRFRITLGVTVLFALALSGASVLFVSHVQASLVADIYAQDSSALEQVGRELTGSTLPAVLTPPANRPGTQLQVVDEQGSVVGATPGAAARPLDPRRLGPNPQTSNPPVSDPPVSNPPVSDPPVSDPPVSEPDAFVPPVSKPKGPNAKVANPPVSNPKPPLDANGNPVSGRPPLDANGNPLPGAQAPLDANGNPLPGAQAPLDANGNPLPGAQAPLDANGRPRPGAQRPPPPSTTIVANPDAEAGRNGAPQDLAVSAVPVVTPAGSVQLIAATPLDGVRQSVETLRQALVVTIPLLVLLIAACAWFITGRALRPVAHLTAQVEEITATTLHERVPEPRAHDEINQLARTMNAMLERLEGSATRQRQFVSDASHELRTPVATIRTELEVALLHPEQASWEEVARRVLDEDERLEHIVADLLTLARFDEQPQLDPTGARTVALSAVVRAEAGRTRRLPVEVVATADEAVVAGRPDELARLVGHLLDNAARHGQSSVQVAVTATVDGVRPVAVLVVDDDGAGVPVEQRATVFERFGRLEAGRSRDDGGAGLGLAVVQRIAERHGGRVTVGDSPSGGARFEVVLPIAPTPPD